MKIEIFEKLPENQNELIASNQSSVKGVGVEK